MQNNFFKKILLFISIFMLLSMLVVSAKDKDDKDKIEKIKDKDDKIKDKDDKIKDKDDLGVIDYTTLIKSEIIYSEKVKVVNNNIRDKKVTEKTDNINSIFKNLEELLEETDEIKKGIKVITPGKSVNSIKEKYKIMKNKMDKINKENESTLAKLNESDKELIIQQNGNIRKSSKRLNKLMSSLENDLNKKKKNEEIFNKIKLMEKEMQIIYRQYRAIEWLLTSK